MFHDKDMRHDAVAVAGVLDSAPLALGPVVGVDLV